MRYFFESSSDISNIPCFQFIKWCHTWLEQSHFHSDAVFFCCQHMENIVSFYRTINNLHVCDYSFVGVVDRIKNKSSERLTLIALWSWHSFNYTVDDLFYSDTGFSRSFQNILFFASQDMHNFFLGLIHFSIGKINLIHHWNDLESLFNRQIQVGQGLRLHTLCSIHQQNSSFYSSQRARYFIVKVYMTRSINKVKCVLFAFVHRMHLHRLKLDCDTSLAFQIHLIQKLLFHFPLFDCLGKLKQPISKRRLTVVNMGDNTKIANMVLTHKRCIVYLRYGKKHKEARKQKIRAVPKKYPYQSPRSG